MIAISLTIAAGIVLLVWLALAPPRLSEGHHKPGRLINVKYCDEDELTEDTE